MKKQLRQQTYNIESIFNKHKKTRINIHIPIRGNTYEYCINLNKEIHKLISSEINFSSKSIQIPHITLYMGYFLDTIGLNKVFEKTEKIARAKSGFEINFSSPYIRGPRNEYIFLDVFPIDLISNLKQEFEKELSEAIIPLDWDIVKAIPHLTIGCSRSIKEHELKSLFNEYIDPPSMKVQAIGVSLCGDRGSCLGTLKTIEFHN